MKNEQLIATVYKKEQYPLTSTPEIAICGRSNCGKSTLLNSLLGKKKIARVSSKPGKTISINFFKYEDNLNLVDLPGYGYAKVSISVKKEWRKLVDDYLKTRGQLRAILLLSDVRRGIEKDEIDFVDWLRENGIHVILIFTKIDKLTNNELRKAHLDILAQASNLWQDIAENIFFVSAEKKAGIENLKKKLRTFLKR